MEWEGKIVTSGFVCSISGKRLIEGDVFFSGLTITNGQFVRSVFSQESWETLEKKEFVSWWKQKMPTDAAAGKQLRLDADSLEQLFYNLSDSRSRLAQCLAYVVGLALIRAKRFIYQKTVSEDNSSWLIVRDKKKDVILRIRDPHLNKEEEAVVLNNFLTSTGNNLS